MSVSQTPRYWVIIPAAGIGSRMQTEMPKQYLSVLQKTVLEWTISLFLAHPLMEKIVVAVAPNDSIWPTLEIAQHPKIITSEGGDSRPLTVNNALQALASSAAATDWVLVHDAARPCLSREDLHRLVNEVGQHPVGGILATAVRDTLKRTTEDREIINTVDRQLLWQAQTPQMYRYQLLKNNLQRVLQTGVTITDDAMVMELAGLKSLVIPGRADNIKITFPEDLAFAQYLLQKRSAE